MWTVSHLHDSFTFLNNSKWCPLAVLDIRVRAGEQAVFLVGFQNFFQHSGAQVVPLLHTLQTELRFSFDQTRNKYLDWNKTILKVVEYLKGILSQLIGFIL